MSQRDSRDPNWLAAPHRTRQSKDNITIGYCLDPFGDGVGAGVETAVQHAITAARTAGIPVREVMPPNATRVAEIWGELLFTETRYTADAIMRQTGSREMIQLLDTYYGETRQLDLPGLLATMAERSTLQRQWGAMFNDIDILLMPTSGRAPFANDLDFTTPTENPALIRDQRFLFIINALQLPSASIPTHLENGIPMGVQLVAPMHEDFFALDVAEKLERHLGRIVEGV
jgi:amidase